MLIKLQAGRFARRLGGYAAAAAAWMLAVALGPASCVAAQLDAAYGPDKSQRLDVFGPERPQKAPAVVWMHGGGFEVGSRAGFRPIAPLFSARGIVAISIDYRMADGSADHRWPAQLEDAQLAMRWVRAHATQLGVDPEHICAMGGSAGGQLSLLLAVLPEIEPGDMAGQLPGVSPRADCAIAISAPTDYLTWGPHPRLDEKLFGQPTRADLVSASSALRLKAGTPPILLVQGTADRLTPPAQALEMRDRLVRDGSSVSLLMHDGGHDLAGLTPKGRSTVLSAAVKFVLDPTVPPALVDPGHLR